MSSAPSPTSAFITLARLLRPQGRRGELLADLLTDFPDLITGPTGVFLVPAGLSAPPVAAARTIIESLWRPTGRNAGRIVVKITGCDSITAAEQLAGVALMIPTEERPGLEAGTFYISDLVGATLYDAGRPVGVITDVEFPTTPDGRSRLEDAAPLLAVQPNGAPDDSEPVLVPFVQAQLLSVDLAARRIDMALPEGLFDLGA